MWLSDELKYYFFTLTKLLILSSGIYVFVLESVHVEPLLTFFGSEQDDIRWVKNVRKSGTKCSKYNHVHHINSEKSLIRIKSN